MRAWIVSVLLLSVGCAGSAYAQAIRVAAAANLQQVLPQIAEALARERGIKAQLTFGASGNLARQIQQGAPFDLFLSADEEFVFRLAATGAARDRGAVYAIGALALYVGNGSAVPLDPQLAGLRERWSLVHKLAIANPEHAPYGRAAQEVLQRAGWWDEARRRLVLGENVAQAAQYVATGAAQAGIVALSVVVEPGFARAGKHVVLPADWHTPLRQRMVVLKAARPGTDDVYAYLQGPVAGKALVAAGFTLPPVPGG